MANIVVYTHPLDRFFIWRAAWPPVIHGYLLCGALRALALRGHRYRVVKKPHPVGADLAILHMDSTIVDKDYLALKNEFPATLNFDASDISKRNVSRSLLTKDAAWRGQVIVKSDLNYGGLVEVRRNKEARRRGLAEPYPGAREKLIYDIYDSAGAVPPEVWSDPDLVVEKFMPEADADGYAMRTWVFLGDEGRCIRHVSPHPVIKSHGVIRTDVVDVPPEMFAERERLGIQYGKFDFVIYEGKPVLLDANKTPGAPDMPRDMRHRIANRLANGLEGFLKARR
ncbi:hypothetical protein [Hyphococcus sp.]|uniref:hypothetical protein n=1 Tax=Hyphococcus sp. TaxID=2038636 RepID=UPI0035C6C4E5